MSAATREAGGVVSIVLACLGPTERLHTCLSSISRHSRRPWELIGVARPERVETAAYLAGVRDGAAVPTSIVAEPGLKGTFAAWKRGLREAHGDFVALLGPSVVVTDAWLDQLVALANANPEIGMVGPAGAGSSAVVVPKPIGEWDLDAFAARWRAARRGIWSEEASLGGRCLLIKRHVLKCLFGSGVPGPGELRPDGLSRLVRAAGFGLARAHDLYVHQASPRARIAALPQPVRRIVVAGPSPNRRCRVSLTMIVRNEEDHLPACLESASGLFDEMIIVDTGSTDRTVEVALSFGAKVFHFPWIDDFAAARNAALVRAGGDYAFWLDADVRIEPDHREKFRALFDGLSEPDAAYVVRCRCDPDTGGGGPTVVDHVRLFPVRSDIRWTYRVHEQILPALRRAGVAVRWTDSVVRHTGYNDPAVRRRKLERDLAILRREVSECPEDPFVLFNLGQIALDLGDSEGALRHLTPSLKGSSPRDSITPKLYVLIARAHQLNDDLGAALTVCERGLAAIGDDAELLFRKGILHRLRGESELAASSWRRVLTLGRTDRFGSVDTGIFGHVTKRNLAVLKEEAGDRGDAERLWREVLTECPGDPMATAALDRLAGETERSLSPSLEREFR